MNIIKTYLYIRDEMIRMEELEQAKRAVQSEKKEPPGSQKIFRVVYEGRA